MRPALVAIRMVFAFVVLSPAGAEDALARLADPATVTSLRAGSPVTRSVAPDGVIGLLPGLASQDAVAADLRAFRPTIGVEYARLVPGRAPAAPADWLRLYNILHAASTMQGVTYFSETRGKREVLFIQSYAVDSVAGRARIPDPVAAALPARSSFTTFQEDQSFGKNVYLEDFTVDDGRIDVRIENQTGISLLLVPIIQPRGFVVRVAFVPVGRDLLFYGAAVLRSGFPIGNRRAREDSLVNRLIAMTDWLAASLAKPATP